MSEVNWLCQDLPEDVIKPLKTKRRRLKNRGYAYNARVRRVITRLEEKHDDSAGVSLYEEPSVSGEQLVSNITQQPSRSPQVKKLTDAIPDSERNYQLPPQFYYPSHDQGLLMTCPSAFEFGKDIDLEDVNLVGSTRGAVSNPYGATSPGETYTVPNFETNQLPPTNADKTMNA